MYLVLFFCFLFFLLFVCCCCFFFHWYCRLNNKNSERVSVWVSVSYLQIYIPDLYENACKKHSCKLCSFNTQPIKPCIGYVVWVCGIFWVYSEKIVVYLTRGLACMNLQCQAWFGAVPGQHVYLQITTTHGSWQWHAAIGRYVYDLEKNVIMVIM